MCHVITRLIVGGAQENTVATCAGLKRLGYDVDLVTGPQTGPEGSLYDAVRAAGVPLIVLKELRRNPNFLFLFVLLIGYAILAAPQGSKMSDEDRYHLRAVNSEIDLIQARILYLVFSQRDAGQADQ